MSHELAPMAVIVVAMYGWLRSDSAGPGLQDCIGGHALIPLSRDVDHYLTAIASLLGRGYLDRPTSFGCIPGEPLPH